MKPVTVNLERARLSLATPKICLLRLRAAYISYVTCGSKNQSLATRALFRSRQEKRAGWDVNAPWHLHTKNSTQTLAHIPVHGMLTFPGTCKARMAHKH